MRFPGKKSRAILDKAKLYYATNTAASSALVATGKDAIITDPDGLQYIDLHCGAGVNNIGMDHPQLKAALMAQAETGIIHSESHNAPNPIAIELAELLATTCPLKRPSKGFFSNSGAEANVAAIKACMAYRFHHGEKNTRRKVMYFENGFAGRMLGLLAATTSNPEAQRDPFWTHCDQENTIYLPYPTRANADLLKERLSAIDLCEVDYLLIEIPCQGEGGIIYADEETLKFLYETTQAAGIFWISDAIQCGMGRCGVLYGPELFPWLESDILTLGKALGGGFAMGGTVFRADLDWQQSEHSNTFGGGPFPCRLALVMIQEVKKLLAAGEVDVIAGAINSLAAFLTKHPCVTEVRGRGAMWAIELATPNLRDALIRIGEETAAGEGYGFKLLAAGEKSVRIMPPLNIGYNLMILAIRLIGLALYEVDARHSST